MKIFESLVLTKHNFLKNKPSLIRRIGLMSMDLPNYAMVAQARVPLSVLMLADSRLTFHENVAIWHGSFGSLNMDSPYHTKYQAEAEKVVF